MCCRAKRKKELLTALQNCFAKTDPTWDTIVKSLQPPEDESYSRDRANAFLPYAEHPCFDDIVDDWLAILRLNITGFDVFPHLVNLAGLHLIKYQLSISRQLLGHSTPPAFICEVVAPRKTLVREVVAAGLDPTVVRLREIAEPPAFTFEASLPLEEAFHLVEERDLERVPVVEGGRLAGVLSRAVVQRRLAEDEPVEDDAGEEAVVL